MTFRRSRSASALSIIILLATACAFVLTRSAPGTAAGSFPTARDARSWPFAWNSIWNMPAGQQAQLVAGRIPAATGYGMTVDEDVIVLAPDAPTTNVVANSAGWDPSRSRCATTQPGKVVLANVPIPPSFSTDPGYLGRTPNMSGALLMGDGDTIVQTQPFHRCGAGGVATAGEFMS